MSDDGNKRALVSIEDVAGLSKPATGLIEAISRATGVVYEPTRIRRKARAQRDAQLIAAQSRIELAEIERRGLERLAREEGRKQQNIETVMEKTLPKLHDTARPEQIDSDWLMHFMDSVKKVSNEDVQHAWSNVLAGEVNSPGSFSKRTLGVLSELSQQEAKRFELLCGFVIDTVGHPVIFDHHDAIYINNGLSFSTLKILEDCGLLEFNELAGFVVYIPIIGGDRHVLVQYFDHSINLYNLKSAERNIKETEKSNHMQLEFGHVRFTNAGSELRGIANPSRIDGFLDYAQDKWKEYTKAQSIE